ncbi:toxin-antitoxin system YwqK family antitoxin [Salegentibacter sp. HM20]
MKTIKTLLLTAIIAVGGLNLAQAQIEPKFEQDGELIKGTFYYEDGSIRQEGTYKDGKLHGKWVSYDQNGKKEALAEYYLGAKTGKWFFWNGDQLTEVDYSNNRIAGVNTWKDGNAVVDRN